MQEDEKLAASKRGKNSRRKGQAFEREVAAMFREALPGAFIARSLQSAGAHTSDVDCPHFWIECKHGAQPNVRGALKQAIEDASKMRSTKIPVAVIKDDRRPAFVTLRLEDFLMLVAEWHAQK